MELGDFEGHWRLTRRIAHDDGTVATFRGTAAMERRGEGLRCVEEGVLRLPGSPPMAASRATLWRPAPGGIAVLFEDGRPFHRIDLASPRPEAVHRCGADLYHVAYDWSDWPEWTVAWRVDGPRHAYAMLTRHAPLAGAGAMRHARTGAEEGPDDP